MSRRKQFVWSEGTKLKEAPSHHLPSIPQQPSSPAARQPGSSTNPNILGLTRQRKDHRAYSRFYFSGQKRTHVSNGQSNTISQTDPAYMLDGQVNFQCIVFIIFFLVYHGKMPLARSVRPQFSFDIVPDQSNAPKKNKIKPWHCNLSWSGSIGKGLSPLSSCGPASWGLHPDWRDQSINV